MFDIRLVCDPGRRNFSADFSGNGRDVTVIEINDELAAQGHFFYKIGLKHVILDVKENYHALLKTRCLEVLDNGVRVMDAEGQKLLKRIP